MEITPTWDDLRVLLAVHRHRSFLAAGRALGLSTSTTGRRIDALEESLGRKLVKRTSAGSEVDPDALRLVQLAEELEHGLESVRRDSQTSKLAGTVRISIGQGFVRPITQVLCAYRREHPETNIELIAENRFSDLAKREADLGLRTARSTSNVLIEKSLGTLHFGLFASVDYAGRRAPSRQLRKQDFAMHDFIGHDGAERRLPQSRWLESLGAKRYPFRTSSDVAMVEAALAGAGIAVLVEEVGEGERGLVRLKVDAVSPTIPMYLVYHRELRSVPRIKAVAAAIEARARASSPFN